MSTLQQRDNNYSPQQASSSSSGTTHYGNLYYNGSLYNNGQALGLPTQKISDERPLNTPNPKSNPNQRPVPEVPSKKKVFVFIDKNVKHLQKLIED